MDLIHLLVRIPKSIIAGLMWLGVTQQQYRTRHTCEQSDEMEGYGWLRHDGVKFGRQVLLLRSFEHC